MARAFFLNNLYRCKGGGSRHDRRLLRKTPSATCRFDMFWAVHVLVCLARAFWVGEVLQKAKPNCNKCYVYFMIANCSCKHISSILDLKTYLRLPASLGIVVSRRAWHLPGSTQRAQDGFIQEHNSNHLWDPYVIESIFLTFLVYLLCLKPH